MTVFTRRTHVDGRPNREKKDGISKTTALHVHYTFLYISLLLLHDYDVKIYLVSRFMEDLKFSFSF